MFSHQLIDIYLCYSNSERVVDDGGAGRHL